jgi:hypothetical protein
VVSGAGGIVGAPAEAGGRVPNTGRVYATVYVTLNRRAFPNFSSLR